MEISLDSKFQNLFPSYYDEEEKFFEKRTEESKGRQDDQKDY
ncbi:MAG: hypothetical protein OEY54_05480 [Nitrosopumilus sp.]|nr:hypothetical protein [Nitrosopumilus sp.]